MRMAYTLQTGREAMDERLAIIVNDNAELQDKLAQFVAADSQHGPVTHIDNLCHGQIKDKQDTLFTLAKDESFLHTVEQWIAHKQLNKLASLWVKGLVVNWQSLFTTFMPTRRVTATGGITELPFCEATHVV